jgi:hypothetical protein
MGITIRRSPAGGRWLEAHPRLLNGRYPAEAKADREGQRATDPGFCCD